MNSKILLLFISFLYVLAPMPVHAIASKRRQQLPEVSVRWSNDATEEYFASAQYFKPYIFSMFAPEFKDHLLPSGDIITRDGRSAVQGNQLGNEIEHTIQELRTGNKALTYFTIL